MMENQDNDLNRTKNKENTIKVLVLGLDNSGKTSLIMSHKGERNLMNYFSLKPTKNYNIETYKSSLNQTPIAVWDFGGQKIFRETHLANLKTYADSAQKLIYVFDVQDKKRYQVALTYLKKILTRIKEQLNEIEIMIYLHKYDPGIEKDPDFNKEKIQNSLIPNIRELMPKNIKYEIDKTSIFTMFRKSTVFMNQID